MVINHTEAITNKLAIVERVFMDPGRIYCGGTDVRYDRIRIGANPR